jgi:hypothetical protein
LGSVKAVTAAQLALAGDGQHSVTLDEAIEAMRLTARDMHSQYDNPSISSPSLQLNETIALRLFEFRALTLALTNTLHFSSYKETSLSGLAVRSSLSLSPDLCLCGTILSS